MQLFIAICYENGAATKIRTRDPLITNQMLYQLSYSGFGGAYRTRTDHLYLAKVSLSQMS
jgi:hypothetical protein